MAYCDSHRAPPRANLEKTVAGAEACLAEDGAYLALLRGFKVAWLRAYGKIPAYAVLFGAPDCARVHHLFAEEALGKPGSARMIGDIWDGRPA